MAKKRYTQFGKTLRTLRERAAESIHELSAALESDTELLQQIENGQARPSEDMVMMLISHYGVEEEKATKLWELADYKPFGESEDEDSHHNEQAKDTPTIVVSMPENRVLYTDEAQIYVDDQGVTIHFMQTIMPDAPKMVVSRVGMSKKQAAALVKTLYSTLKTGSDKQDRPPRQLNSGL